MINELGDRIYVPGDKVWYVRKPTRLTDRPNTQGEVIVSFMEKGEQYLVLRNDPHPELRTARYVWDELKGLSNQEKQLKVPDSRARREQTRIIMEVLAEFPPEAFESSK